jgi:hypothetical protein
MDASRKWFATPPLWHIGAVGGVHLIKAMRTGIYARVSTPRQAQADGIAQPLDRLQAHALQQGWTVTAEHIFRDDGYSGARLTGLASV